MLHFLLLVIQICNTNLEELYCSTSDKSARGNLCLTEKTRDDQGQESAFEEHGVLQDTAWSGDEILAEAQVWVRRLACICFAVMIIAEVITGKVHKLAPSFAWQLAERMA